VDKLNVAILIANLLTVAINVKLLTEGMKNLLQTKLKQ
jgi:hypothetical protein